MLEALLIEILAVQRDGNPSMLVMQVGYKD